MKIIRTVASFTFSFFILSNVAFAVVDSGQYNPQINPEDFTTTIDNPYFTLTPGKTIYYEKEFEGEKKEIIYIVTGQTKEVMGVTTLIVWDREWADGELEEETFDWFAQDKDGNVWYFGEDSKEYEDGEVSSTHGSWEAGVDGAKPGIIMKAKPKVGDSYYMEYYEGEAVDTLDVLAINQSIQTPYGDFNDCVKVKEGSALAKDLLDHKYYCSEIGGVAYTIDVRSGEEELLVNLTYTDKTVTISDKDGEIMYYLGGGLVLIFIIVIVKKNKKNKL